MEYSSRYMHTPSSNSSSGPIEIPLSTKARYRSPLHASRNVSPSPCSPELLFEMSPFESHSSSPPCHSFRSSYWGDDDECVILQPQAQVSVMPSSTPSQSISIPPASPLAESYTSSHNKHTRFRDSFNSRHEPGLTTSSAVSVSLPPATPPVIRTSAVHKIYGFHPDPKNLPKTPEFGHESAPQKRISALTTTGSASPRPTLSPASGSPVALPWLLPGSKDDDEDYLSCSSQSFDFKKFLIYRLDKGRMRGIRQ